MLPQTLAGRYRVVRELGRGGMGVVYLAEEAGGASPVAVKVLHGRDLSERALRHFEQEFRTLTELSHPNLTEVHDFGRTALEDGGPTHPYFTMEYVEGDHLDRYLAGRPGDDAALFRCLAQVGEALAYLHGRDIVHQDVKPSNILVSGEGERAVVKLMDLGLAARAHDAAGEGRLRGTVAYVSPEAARGESVDPRADLYSLGCVLYEIVTGRPPFAGASTLEVLRAHLEETPAPPSAVRRGVPPALEALILRLLEKDPGRRPASADHFLEALARAAGGTLEAHPAAARRRRVLGSGFVGREAELERLAAHYGDVSHGAFRIVLLAGDEGAGKSRLLREFQVRRQIEGGDVFIGRGAESGAGAFADALARALRARGALGSGFPRSHEAALDAFLSAGPAGDGAEAPTGIASAVAAALQELSRSAPLALAVEDLNTADETTLEVLRHLATALGPGSHPEGPRVLVLGTYRSGEVSRSSPLFDLLATGRERGAVEELFVPPLPVDGVARMLRAMLGVDPVPQAFAERVAEETRGNPLHVAELVAYLAEEGHVVPTDPATLDPAAVARTEVPGRLRGLLERRVRRIPAELRGVAQAAAALWDRAPDPDAVSAVTGLRWEAVARSFTALRRAGVFEETADEGGAPVFHWSCAGIATILADTTPSEEAGTLHARAVAYLQKRGIPARPSAWSAFARHAEAAGQGGRAVDAWERAGDAARALHTPHEAVAAYTRGLDVLGRSGEPPAQALVSLLEKRSSALASIGDTPRAEDDARRMLARAADAGLDRWKARAHLRLGEVLAAREDAAAGQHELEVALEAAERTGDAALCVDAELFLGRVAAKLGQFREAVSRLERAASLASEGGRAERRVEALLALGAVRREQGDWREALRAFEEASSLAAGRARPETDIAIREGIAAVHEMQGRHREAAAAWAAAKDRAAEVGDVRAVATMHARLGASLARTGDDEGARRALEDALSLQRRLGSHDGAAESLRSLADIELLHGLHAAALDTAGEALREARRSPRREAAAEALALLGRIHLQIGSLDEAEALLEEAHRGMEERSSPLHRAGIVADLGELRARRGAAEEGRRLLQEAAFTARRSGDKALEASATRRLGEACLAENDHDRAMAACRKALALVEGSGLPREEADGRLLRARIDLARPGGDVVRAESDAVDALSRYRELRDLDGSWRAEHVAARAAARLGRKDDAAERVERAWRLVEGAGSRLPPSLREAWSLDPWRRELREDRERLRGRGAREMPRVERPAAESERARDEAVALRRLLDVNRVLGSTRDPDALLGEILRAALEVTGAERAFVLLRDGEDLVARSAAGPGGEPPTGDALVWSRSVARRVLENGEPLLATDAEADARLSAFESVHALGIRSVIAVPLRSAAGIEGALYLDSRIDRALFGPFHLELAVRLADQAAVAVETARLLARVEDQRIRLERLNAELERTAEEQRQALSDARERLRASLSSTELRWRFEEMVGGTPAMQRVYHLIERLATHRLPVLIVGESGTGKELVARALHTRSGRSEGPFFTVNCAALAETLLESELFGHRRGAFTGADRNKPGFFELAHGGTLFLDEIGEMGAAMQAKLLRVLQEGEVLPLGGDTPIRVDVRVVSATHRDLRALIKEGRFREDLFYRIHAARIDVPPLRERREDVPLLVDRFLAAIAEDEGQPKRSIEPAALRRLQDLPWQGNVRELQHVVLRVSAFSRGDTITLRDIERYGDVGAPSSPAPIRPAEAAPERVESLDELERRQIARALAESQGNKTRAAEILGINRATLFRKLKRFGLES